MTTVHLPDGSTSQPDAQTPGGDAGGEHATCTAGDTQDVLLVLDRSASMKNGTIDHWTPVTTGINAIVGEAQAHARFGLMLYPGTSPGAPEPQDCSMISDFNLQLQCYVNQSLGADTCTTGQLSVPVAANSAPAIAAAMHARDPFGSTPTAATLELAKTTLANTTRQTVVVLLTDGTPNCAASADPLNAVDRSEAAVKSLAAAGFKTYVLGIDVTEQEVKDALNKLAAAGGTGESSYRPVLAAGEVAQTIRELLKPVTCP